MIGGIGDWERWGVWDWERWGEWGTGRGGQREEPLPLTHLPSFQLCCCAGQKGPVCQSLHCLPDGQAVTLPVVRVWGLGRGP